MTTSLRRVSPRSAGSSVGSAPFASPFGAALRGAWVPAMLVGALVAAGYLVVAGPAAGASALIGVAIAAAFFGTVLLLAGRWVRKVPPAVGMFVALTLYSLQMLALLAVYQATGNIVWLDDSAVGVAILVVAVVWQAAQMRAWRRARFLVFDEPASRT